jgi:hypothetical protein
MPPVYPTVHDTDNYRIGKGIISFKSDGDSLYRDLGNCPSLLYTPNIVSKDHFSSRLGIKTKDLSRITEISAKVKFTMEEIVAENLAFFFLSDVETSTAGYKILRGLSKTTFKGSLKFTGENDAGRQIDWVGDVSFVPSGDFQFITDSDDYTTITVECDVLADVNGDYGILTDRGVVA